MKNILVATDFSNNAYNALYYITDLLKERSCNFYLLNSYTEHSELLTQKVGAHGRHSLIDQLRDESIEGLNQVYHRIHLDQGNPLHQFKPISRNANFTDALNQTIEEYSIDLLVLGNRGNSGTGNIFWGSSVIKAIDDVTNCPILTVPKEIECEIPKEIAFASDYKSHFNAKVLQPLLSMASICNSNVCVVHINEEQRLSNEQKSNLLTLREYLGDIKHSIHWMPDFASKSEVINTFIEELGIGMLAMTHHKHGWVNKLLSESVVENISFEIDIPLLILPE